jgi:hypothetical protein
MRKHLLRKATKADKPAVETVTEPVEAKEPIKAVEVKSSAVKNVLPAPSLPDLAVYLVDAAGKRTEAGPAAKLTPSYVAIADSTQRDGFKWYGRSRCRMLDHEIEVLPVKGTKAKKAPKAEDAQVAAD